MKYLNNSIKRNNTDYVMNRISSLIIIILTIVLVILYSKDAYDKRHRTLNYIEMRHSYKNCIIVYKTEYNGYKLYLHNPVSNKAVTIKVEDYIYFNWFIGDTIK